MTRKMYDSVTASSIPRTAGLVGGYVDGRYKNVDELRKRLPKAKVVTITVLGRAGANVCDCETGDLTPSSAAVWARREVLAGRRPTIYCLQSQLATVKRAVRLRMPRRARLVSYWVANYDGVAVVPAGCVAKQYQDPPRSGGHYDLSVVAAHWPGVDPQPAAKKTAPATANKAASPPVLTPGQPQRIVDLLTFILARKKTIVAAVFGVATWATAALADGKVTQNEWLALFLAAAGVGGVHQVNNKPKPPAK